MGLREAVRQSQECRTRTLGDVDMCDVVDGIGLCFGGSDREMANTRKSCQAVSRNSSVSLTK